MTISSYSQALDGGCTLDIAFGVGVAAGVSLTKNYLLLDQASQRISQVWQSGSARSASSGERSECFRMRNNECARSFGKRNVA